MKKTMKKRIRLNDNGRMAVAVILFIVFIVVGTMSYLNRIEKINNGEMILISDSEMDR